MINNGVIILLLYCCDDIKSHRSKGDAVPLKFETFKIFRAVKLIQQVAADLNFKAILFYTFCRMFKSSLFLALLQFPPPKL